ncbi:thiamine phosphate synthase [Chryseobacterium sp.]|uniref:thiamine phosphate synthase n=1 Tax=Chryseobacterium sp. TaxID=1871047 RepID=UPI002898E423|nr:thiamine phosphate synthase [Chryseobacterium sp.]
MEVNKKQLNTGIYLIIDPSMNEEKLLSKLELVLKGNICAIQIWDHFKEKENTKQLLTKIFELTSKTQIPVLMNNQWEFLEDFPFDGIHFDKIPHNLDEVKEKIDRPFILGITCNNDLEHIAHAEKLQFDYLSFCSMYPSLTANSCELVSFETVKQAKKIFSGKIFLAGGINEENIKFLKSLDYDGIAMVSGIMNSEKPLEILKTINKSIKNES